MKKINFAIVEDDELTLEDRIENLKEIEKNCEIELVFSATTKRDFFNKYNEYENDIDALILDIELPGSPQGGIEIAQKVKKPCIFTSGNNAEYLKDIENIKHDYNLPVDHLTKPIPDERFKKTIENFCKEIRNNVIQKVTLKNKQEEISVHPNDIVMIRQEVKGGKGKTIYFTNRKPFKLGELAFDKINLWTNEKLFKKFTQDTVININNYEIEDSRIKVSYIDETCNKKVELIKPTSYGLKGEFV